MLTLKDPRITVTVDRTPAGGWQGYVDTEQGLCFDDGTHARHLHWHDGTKAKFLNALAEHIRDDEIVECLDPDCEQCHQDDE